MSGGNDPNTSWERGSSVVPRQKLRSITGTAGDFVQLQLSILPERHKTHRSWNTARRPSRVQRGALPALVSV